MTTGRYRLHDWQQRCLAKSADVLASGRRWLLWRVSAGSGKTIAALHFMADSKEFDVMVVLTPKNAHVLGYKNAQAAVSNMGHGDGLHVLDIDEYRRGISIETGERLCFVATYQAAHASKDELDDEGAEKVGKLCSLVRSLCEMGRRVLLVLDEAHHLAVPKVRGDDSQEMILPGWAKPVKRLCGIVEGSGGAILLMTATPKRHDRIPILSHDGMYDDCGNVISDFDYSYAEGVRDNIVRPTVARYLDADSLEIIDSGSNSVLASAGNTATDAGRGVDNHWQGILSSRPFMERAVSYIIDLVSDMRARGRGFVESHSGGKHTSAAMRRAAGMIHCASIKDAIAAFDIAQAYAPGCAIVVHANSKEPHYRTPDQLKQAILEFADPTMAFGRTAFSSADRLGIELDSAYDRAPFIVVSVDLLSEGTDIPRITHILELANQHSPTQIEQLHGRAIRKMRGVHWGYDRAGKVVRLDVEDDLHCTLIVPPTAGWEKHAAALESGITVGEPAIMSAVRSLGEVLDQREARRSDRPGLIYLAEMGSVTGAGSSSEQSAAIRRCVSRVAAMTSSALKVQYPDVTSDMVVVADYVQACVSMLMGGVDPRSIKSADEVQEHVSKFAAADAEMRVHMLETYPLPIRSHVIHMMRVTSARYTGKAIASASV